MVYTGKGTDEFSTYADVGLAAGVVMKLTEPLWGKGHIFTLTDVKVINLISSAHDADQDFDTGFVARYISGHSTQVHCPKAIIDYQQFM